MPYPADYGGVVDVFYRIKALHEIGVKIHLHCFEYGRGQQDELNEYCVEVNYYKRNTGLKGFSFNLPYIVNSRINKALLQNLLKDEYPVLLEGIHCTYFLFTDQLKSKKVFVRLHNVEFEYYHQLSKSENSFFKKMYFQTESRFLKKYEKKIASKATLLAITPKDASTYKNNFAATAIKYLPVFLQYYDVESKEGQGDYCLYQGNLSVADNEKAAIWLCQNVFNELNIPFIIVGKAPSENLKGIAQKNKNISLVANPTEIQMNDLVHNAQINILPSFNSTGIKVKLLNTLFNGRYCIANNATIAGTGLETLCHIAETKEDYKTFLKQLFDEPFTASEIIKRKQILEKEFNSKSNAELLMKWIQ